jgi:hypothetical protein
LIKSLLLSCIIFTLFGCTTQELQALSTFVDGYNKGMGNSSAYSGGGRTVNAYLTNISGGASVTGQAIISCTYSYGSTSFVRNFPSGSTCPSSVPVQ